MIYVSLHTYWGMAKMRAFIKYYRESYDETNPRMEE